MKKIQFTSRMLSLFFRTISFALPIIFAYLILFNFERMIAWGAWSSFSINDTTPFSLIHRMIILIINFLPLSITVLICHKLSRLFRLYEQGKLFEEENIKLIRSISIIMIIGEGIQFLYQPLMSIALTYNNPIGQRVAGMSIGTTNATTLIIAFIILIASWIVKEANQLKSETQLTI